MQITYSGEIEMDLLLFSLYKIDEYLQEKDTDTQIKAVCQKSREIY